MNRYALEELRTLARAAVGDDEGGRRQVAKLERCLEPPASERWQAALNAETASVLRPHEWLLVPSVDGTEQPMRPSRLNTAAFGELLFYTRELMPGRAKAVRQRCVGELAGLELVIWGHVLSPLLTPSAHWRGHATGGRNGKAVQFSRALRAYIAAGVDRELALLRARPAAPVIGLATDGHARR